MNPNKYDRDQYVSLTVFGSLKLQKPMIFFRRKVFGFMNLAQTGLKSEMLLFLTLSVKVRFASLQYCLFSVPPILSPVFKLTLFTAKLCRIIIGSRLFVGLFQWLKPVFSLCFSCMMGFTASV